MTGYCSGCGQQLCCCDDYNKTKGTYDTDTGEPMTTHDDTPALLTELYELSNNGTSEWWVKELRPVEGDFGHDHDFFYDCDMGYDRSGVKNQHAYDLIKAHAERWLESRRWFRLDHKWIWYTEDLEDADGDLRMDSLPDAIRAEQERGK